MSGFSISVVPFLLFYFVNRATIHYACTICQSFGCIIYSYNQIYFHKSQQSQYFREASSEVKPREVDTNFKNTFCHY